MVICLIAGQKYVFRFLIAVLKSKQAKRSVNPPFFSVKNHLPCLRQVPHSLSPNSRKLTVCWFAIRQRIYRIPLKSGIFVAKLSGIHRKTSLVLDSFITILWQYGQ